MKRVTPIVLITAPLLTSRELVAAAAQLGSSLGVEPVDVRWEGSIAATLKTIAATLTKSYPPVLIGHGAGALVVEKYIESYPAKGLVFVNPWTIDTVNVILREWPKRYPKAWQRVQTQGGSLRVLLDDPDFQRDIIGKRTEPIKLTNTDPANALPLEFLIELIKTPPKCDEDTNVPALVACSIDDAIVDVKDLAQTIVDYEPVKQSHVYTDAKNLPGTHFPMLDESPKIQQQFIKTLHSWLDENHF